MTFLSPWLLGFLAVLPVIWWLLRLTPPSPKRVVFPALMLLRDLAPLEQTPAHTPWWLVVLRLFIAALIIVGMAEPRLHPPQALSGKGTLLIAIDNDWASARAWPKRQEALRTLLDQADREQRDVIILPTTPPANGEALSAYGPFPAQAARGYADTIAPQPWPSDWKTAAAIMEKLDCARIGHAVWMNGGLGDAEAQNFAHTMQECTETNVLSDGEATSLYLLTPPEADGDSMMFHTYRAAPIGGDTVSIAAQDKDGETLAHIPVTFTAGATDARHAFDLPLDIRNRTVRLSVEASPTAGGTVLLDERWHHRPVGLVGHVDEAREHSLLSGVFYIDRALRPFANLHNGTLDQLLDQHMAVIILTDRTVLSDADTKNLRAWMQQGGVLVRFAGEQLAHSSYQAEQDLLPVRLRSGDRNLGGALSWATPQSLRPFSPESPFHDLTVPPDATVGRQILAEPNAELAAHTWASLQDGTPLVTAKSFGQGLSILFHVPATADWSSLPLSGLFVDMLHHIVAMSQGVGATTIAESAPPYQMLDGFGVLHAPDSAAQVLNDADPIKPDPHHPPGLYGTEHSVRAFNLGQSLLPPSPLMHVDAEPYPTNNVEWSLQPLLLVLAFMLLLGDFVLSLWLRGLIPLRRVMVSLLFLLIFTTTEAHAVPNEKAAIEFTGKTYLAYVITGNSTTDKISADGLLGLSHILERRTTLDDVGVTGVDPARDELAFFPLLYWPLNGAAAPLSPQAVQNINDYLRHGGMIVFDTAQGASADPSVFMAGLKGIAIPSLIQMPEDHVLTHSFYRLDGFPGRFAGNEIWIEPEQSAAYDNVASVIVGSNDWAAAWAIDKDGNPEFSCAPNGEQQREYAYRFGVNLVMMVLTGNYKADQLHAKALLERSQE